MSLDLMPQYKMERDNSLRRSIKTIKYVILNQSNDFLKKNIHFDPDLIYDSYKNVMTPELLKLAKEEYSYSSHFSHIYFELINKHYLAIHGIQFKNRSPFLEELKDYALIESKYTDSILVTINGNYSKRNGDIIEPEEKRLIEYTLADLSFTFDVGLNNIITLDSIFDYKENEKLGDNKFNIQPTRFNFKEDIKNFIRKF